MAHSSTAPSGTVARRCAWIVLAAALVSGPAAHAQYALPADADPAADAPVFSLATPVGPLSYFPGRGLHVGDTGLIVGGYAIVEVDDEEGEPTTVELDGVNLLVLFEPIRSLRFFGELEVGNLFVWEPEGDDVDSDATLDIERLYGSWSLRDAATLRVGKFQTPVGRWNLVPAEPFVWTATEPALLERAFDEHQTGVALLGTFYPGPAGNTLDYWLYGQVFDPLDADDDPEPAERTAGGRLAYGDALGRWSVGGSLLASERKGHWSYLAGLDAVLRLGPVELASEAVAVTGSLSDRELWSVYLQGVYDLGSLHRVLRGLYLVGRFEHYDPRGSGEDAELWDVGLTWMPKPYLNLKAGYRLSDGESEDAPEGVFASLSVLF